VSEKPIVLVFCERIDNESFCESIIRELEAFYDVRPCGPNWPKKDLDEIDADSRGEARFYLELDSASGVFARPKNLRELEAPKFAWLIDTHKKPTFHRELAREMDVTFYAMQNWGHVFETPAAWLPLHCDERIFYPQEREREFDIAFVGSYGWRVEPVLRIAKKHGLKVHVECTTGELEKTKTSEIYARAKLVFNRHITNDLNFRVFETQACGRLLLTDAQWNGQYELFEDGTHYVLYKDERDLEEKILYYLKDDEARARIERAAAAHAQRSHTTRARVKQLRDAIEAYLERTARERVSAEVREPELTRENESQDDGLGERGTGRYLVFTSEAPGATSPWTYAEELSRGLAKRKHEVTLVRPRRTLLPRRATTSGELHVVELGLAVPGEAPTWSNNALKEAASLHAAFVRAAKEMGKLDVVLAEGSLGALVAQPFAQREKLPLVFAIERSEVSRRGNRLTREQLYWAELEHWAVDRADLVLVPDRAAQADVEGCYRAKRVVPVSAKSGLRRHKKNSALLSRLGIEVPFVLLLSGELTGLDVRKLLKRPLVEECTVLLATPQALWRRSSASDLTLLSPKPLLGPVLAQLMTQAQAVLALDPGDPRNREARRLGASVNLVPKERRARGLEGILEYVRSARRERAPSDSGGVGELEDALALVCARPREEVTSGIL
jgi:hypothetical protein